MISTPHAFLLKRKYTFWTLHVINLHLFNHLYLFFLENLNNLSQNQDLSSYYKVWQKNIEPLTIRYAKVTSKTTQLWTSKLTYGNSSCINSSYLISTNVVFARQANIKQTTLRYTLSYTHFILFQQSLFLHTYLRYFIGNTSFRYSQFFVKKNLLCFKKQTFLQLSSLQKFL